MLRVDVVNNNKLQFLQQKQGYQVRLRKYLEIEEAVLSKMLEKHVKTPKKIMELSYSVRKAEGDREEKKTKSTQHSHQGESSIEFAIAWCSG